MSARLPPSATARFILGTDTYGGDWDPSRAAYYREWSAGLTAAQVDAERKSATPLVTGATLEADTPLDSDLLDTTANNNDWAESGGTIAFDDQPALAIRWYPSNKLPPVRYHGSSAGTWDSGFDQPACPVQDVYEFVADKTTAGTIRRTRISECNQDVPIDPQLATFVSPPLAAQTIGGSFQCCFLMYGRWVGTGLASTATGRYRVHIYIAVGQSRTVRHTLLDNYQDTVDFTTSGLGRWQTLATAQSLTTGDALLGDVVVVEIGARFQTINALINPITYPPTEWAVINMRYSGNAGNADAVNGDTGTVRESWIEFSNGLTALAATPPPANDACADAIVIASLPYASADVDSSGLTDTKRAVWWTWTAPANMRVCLRAAGTTYVAIVTLMTGGCGALVADIGLEVTSDYGPHRSQAMRIFNAVSGTQVPVPHHHRER